MFTTDAKVISMSQSVISLRISDTTKNRLDQLAGSTKRSRSFLAAEALSEYLERNEWQISAIDEAVLEADKGVFVSNEAVTEWLKSWGTTHELPAPKPDVFRHKS
jgi:RHH-type transcriptional regulator, rel operon repressor / antitoxin RelB